MNTNTDHSQDFSPYQVRSPREIISILRNIATSKQLVHMKANDGQDSAVTSILHVDDAEGVVIIDCAASAITNQRLLDSEEIAFDTLLESIRILFFAVHTESCLYEGRPALRIDIPHILIRLQRREFYRVMVPVTNPVRCTIAVPTEPEGTKLSLIMPLYNVSAGGIAVIDEKKQMPSELGRVYENCKIDLPGGAVAVTLRAQNSQELSLTNGKNIRRMGFMFLNPSNATEAAIQRYITKLEREHNARSTGMA